MGHVACFFRPFNSHVEIDLTVQPDRLARFANPLHVFDGRRSSFLVFSAPPPLPAPVPPPQPGEPNPSVREVDLIGGASYGHTEEAVMRVTCSRGAASTLQPGRSSYWRPSRAGMLRAAPGRPREEAPRQQPRRGVPTRDVSMRATVVAGRPRPCSLGGRAIGARPARGCCGRRQDDRARRRPGSSHGEKSLAAGLLGGMQDSRRALVRAYYCTPQCSGACSTHSRHASSKCAPYTPHCH